MNEKESREIEKESMAVDCPLADDPVPSGQCPIGREGKENTHDKPEDVTSEECRRTCKRHFWTELLRTVAKIAGVVLAAMGLSSFGEED